MAQVSARVLQWASLMQQRGYAIRTTKNGHPYVLMQRAGTRLPRVLRKQSHLRVAPTSLTAAANRRRG